MLPQLVPMAPVMKVVVLSTRLAKELSSEPGLA